MFTREDFERVMLHTPPLGCTYWHGRVEYPSREDKSGYFFCPVAIPVVEIDSSTIGQSSVSSVFEGTENPLQKTNFSINFDIVWAEVDPNTPMDAQAISPRLRELFGDAQALQATREVLKMEQLYNVDCLVKALGLPEPTFAVGSGNKSVHFFWKLSAPSHFPQWLYIQEALAAYLGADPVSCRTNAFARLGGGLRGPMDCLIPQAILGGTGQPCTIEPWQRFAEWFNAAFPGAYSINEHRYTALHKRSIHGPTVSQTADTRAMTYTLRDLAATMSEPFIGLPPPSSTL